MTDMVKEKIKAYTIEKWVWIKNHLPEPIKKVLRWIRDKILKPFYKWYKKHKPETFIIVILAGVVLYNPLRIIFGWPDIDLGKKYPATNACIIDSVRHYPPVVRGGNVYITCKIVNIEQKRNEKDAWWFMNLWHDFTNKYIDNRLLITDIQPANLSIEQLSENPKRIINGDTAVISFVFNTDKIVGYTQQKIRFYGNINNDGTRKTDGMLELTFDTHVVRPAGNESDYEDIYFEGKQDITNVIVDGELGEKGYVTDDTYQMAEHPATKDIGNKTVTKEEADGIFDGFKSFFNNILNYRFRSDNKNKK